MLPKADEDQGDTCPPLEDVRGTSLADNFKQPHRGGHSQTQSK